MPATHSTRLTRALAFLTVLGLAIPAFASTPIFQPLNEPSSGEQHPGKIVWVDLFTTNPVASTKFYSGLFGWTANIIDQKGKAYTVFSNGSRPVAGLAPRFTKNMSRPSRWIAYVAVTNLNSTLARVTKAGGVVRAPARDFPDRGAQAIITDNEGSPVGLLQSSSGDSADGEPQPGEWNWFELYANEPKATSAFYGRVFDYAVTPDTRTTRKNDYLFSTDDLPRAGVAPVPDREDAKAGWLCVVRVANIDETVARVPGLGGEVLVAPRATAYGSRFSIIADSTGGTIGLIEYVDSTNPATRP